MNKRKSAKAKTPDVKNIAEFESLSDAEKEAVYQSVDRPVNLSEWRKLTPKERRGWEEFRGRALANRKVRGRPQLGKGAKVVAVSIEAGLLQRAESFAKRNRMKRSELFAAGIIAVMEHPKFLKKKGAA